MIKLMIGNYTDFGTGSLTLKVSTLIFFILCGFGFYIISNYLSSNGLLRESFSYANSFNYLFSIALFFIFIVFSFSVFFVFMPFIINEINNSKVFKWPVCKRKEKIIYDASIYIWLLLTVSLYIVIYNDLTKNFIYIFISLSVYLIIMVSLYAWCRSEKGRFLINVVLLIPISSALFVINVVFIASLLLVINSIYSSDLFFIVFYFIFLLVNFLFSISFYNKKIAFIIYSALVLLLFSAVFFKSNIVLEKIGVGGYQSSYIVKYQDVKYYDGLLSNVTVDDSSCDTVIKANKEEYQCNKNGKSINKKYPKMVLLEKVWVVADLPKKLIISSNKDNKDNKDNEIMYSIRKSNIVSEVFNKKNT